MVDELHYEPRMSDSDARMWTIEKDPLLRSTITAVSLLDGRVHPERFTEKVELTGVDFVTSNVPGAPVPLFAAGAEIVQQFPFGPLSGAAANITLLSWMGQVCIGINVDPVAVTEPEAFHACLADGFDEVIAAG